MQTFNELKWLIALNHFIQLFLCVKIINENSSIFVKINEI